jgi:aconitate hydratase
MKTTGHDTLKTLSSLTVDGKTYSYFSIPEAAKTLGDVSRLPVSLKVLLENVLRFEDGHSYHVADAQAIADWLKDASSAKEVPF